MSVNSLAAAAKPIIISRRENKLEATLFAKSVVAAEYDTLPGNQPATFGNVIAVWQGTIVQWGVKPLVMRDITSNDPQGDTAIKVPGSPPLTVAYGTSASGTAYCATVELTQPDEPGKAFATSLDLPWVGNDAFIFSFDTPTGNQPDINENWLGLWAGGVATYDGSNRIKKVAIDSKESSDSLPVDQRLTSDTVYTLGYGCGPRDTDLAATLTFKTPPFLVSLHRFLQLHDREFPQAFQLLRELSRREE